jgi:hypothetical protein
VSVVGDNQYESPSKPGASCSPRSDCQRVMTKTVPSLVRLHIGFNLLHTVVCCSPNYTGSSAKKLIRSLLLVQRLSIPLLTICLNI